MVGGSVTGKQAAVAAFSVGVLAAAAAIGVSASQNEQKTVESPPSQEISVTPMPVHPPSLFQFKQFVIDSQAAAYYPKWVQSNCGAARGGTPQAPVAGTDAFKWYGYRDAIIRDTRPTVVPIMVTSYGRALVDGGLITLQAAP